METKFFKRLIAVAFAILICVSFISAFCVSIGAELEQGSIVPDVTTATEASSTVDIVDEPQLIDVPIVYPDVQYKYCITPDEAVTCRDEVNKHIELIKTEIASGKYSIAALQVMSDEVTRLEADALKFTADIAQFNNWMSEYPYAAEVWFRLRSEGMSPAAVAGILGNMMAETGGGTLNFKPGIYDGTGSFYGICQWSTYYYPSVNGSDFDFQVDFLIETMPKEYKNFGSCYARSFTLEDYYAMTSPEDAAMAFAKVYERCGSGSYGWRQWGAREAYNYFMSTEAN
jgi:hypothetical protein